MKKGKPNFEIFQYFLLIGLGVYIWSMPIAFQQSYQTSSTVGRIVNRGWSPWSLLSKRSKKVDIIYKYTVGAVTASGVETFDDNKSNENLSIGANIEVLYDPKNVRSSRIKGSQQLSELRSIGSIFFLIGLIAVIFSIFAQRRSITISARKERQERK